jgi:hypothetical protein
MLRAVDGGVDVSGTVVGAVRGNRTAWPIFRQSAHAPLCALLLALLPIAVWGTRLSSVTYASYAAGVLVFFVLPGWALTRLSGLQLRSEQLLVVALGLGIAASNLSYAIARYLDVPWAYLLLPAASCVALLYRRQRQPIRPLDPALPVIPNLLVWLVVVAAAAPLARMSVHATDFTPDAAGLTQLVVPADGTLHAAIANELTHSFPPRNPFAADRPLDYHYANELSAAVFCKFLQLPATTVCLRLLPTLFIGYAALAVYALIRRLTGSLPAALFTPLLVLLGEDFSYVPGLLEGSSGLWAGEYFSSPSVFGLYFVNPNLPALGAFFGGCLGLSHALGGGQKRAVWAGVSALALALAGSYKIFFGIQTAFALAALLLLCRGARRRHVALVVLALIVAAALLVLPTSLARSGGKVIEVVPTLHTDYVPTALARLGLTKSPWFAAVAQMFTSKQVSATGLLQLALLGLPLFIVGTFGVRLLGIFRLLGAILRPSSTPLLLAFLAWFVLWGYVLGLGSRVTPVDYPADYNNSAWFLVASKLVGWVFVAVVLGRVFKTWSPRRAAWLSVLQVGLLAAPATINTFVKGSRNGTPTLASKAEMAVTEHFRANVAAGTVVLCESANLRRLLLAVSAARVPYAPEMYVTSFLRKTQIEQREREQKDFWQAWQGGVAQRHLLERYEIGYVVTARALHGAVPSFQYGDLRAYSARSLRALGQSQQVTSR